MQLKMFLWRTYNNLLPTRANLLRQGVVLDVQCPIYGKNEETVKHILWNCPSAQDVWGCGSRKIQKSIGEGSTFFHVVEEMLGCCGLAEFELMVVVAQKI